MILLLIFTILLIAVEVPVAILYRRKEDMFVLGMAVLAEIMEILFIKYF